MRNPYAILPTLLLGLAITGAQAQTIQPSGFTWSPSLLTVTAGTPITFIVNGNHHAREVSQATWNANGTTSNGGFDFTTGTHTLTLTIPGTYYYVCVPHASMGMKGRIVVETNTGVSESNSPVFGIYPNPASEEITVNSAPSSGMQLSMIDAQGREVLRRSLTGTSRISVGHLAAGDYTALLLDAKGTIQERQRITIAR
ncbi:MAG TPA: plastocyanin/azurin family copper-binding protein [Flavobacteriales bacterium]|nr:plastocyanin/azurin family copper-binding protein [Flavobacteriales bacterium]